MAGEGELNAACGHPVLSGARFCPQCGQEVAVRDESAPPEPGEVAHEEVAPLSAVPADPPAPNSVLPTAPLGNAPQWPWATAARASEPDTVIGPPLPRELETAIGPPLPGEPEPEPAPEPPAADPFASPPVTGIDRIRQAPIPDRFDPRRPRRPQRSRRLLPVILGAAAVVVIVVAGVVVLTRHSSSASAGDTFATIKATPTAASTPAATAAAVPVRATPEGQAATVLAGLLAQGVDQLGNVTGATADVRDCGPNLRADKLVFAKAAGDRQRLISSLTDMKGRSALPAALVPDLISGWQASAKEYRDLSLWANDAIYDGCAKSRITSDANLRASDGPADQATGDKNAFVRLWAPIAEKYGLASYEAWQL